jgi:DNA-binding NtrC family response regulator
LSKTKEKTTARRGASASNGGLRRGQAGTAEEGLRLADRADLVLTDLRARHGRARTARTFAAAEFAVPGDRDDSLRTVESAVEAMKAGAVDFLMKPFSFSIT